MSLNEDLLSGYLDGELTPEERSTVEAELARSPEWRALLEELRGTRTLLRTLPLPEAPSDLIAAVRERDRVEVAEVETTAPVRALRPRWQRPLTWAAAASAAAVLVGVLVVPRPDRSEPDVPALADAHAARSSLDIDPLGALATLGVDGESGR